MTSASSRGWALTLAGLGLLSRAVNSALSGGSWRPGTGGQLVVEQLGGFLHMVVVHTAAVSVFGRGREGRIHKTFGQLAQKLDGIALAMFNWSKPNIRSVQVEEAT